tara:strand:+ start:331 stop:858 length:528 start_codon:yes stop_codon:yes gene_type:complete
MKFKQFSREELMEYLVNGIPLPESAMINDKVLDFYFEQLEEFINGAENDFWALRTSSQELVISFGKIEYVVLKTLAERIFLLMSPNASEPEDMTTEEAENVVGLIYGIVVYNVKWDEMSKLADDLTQTYFPELESLIKKEAPLSPNKYTEIPNRTRSLELSNIKEFIKKNRKYYV